MLRLWRQHHPRWTTVWTFTGCGLLLAGGFVHGEFNSFRLLALGMIALTWADVCRLREQVDRLEKRVPPKDQSERPTT